MHELLNSYSNDQIETLKAHLEKRVHAPAKTSGLGVVYDLTYWCNLQCRGCGVFAKHCEKSNELALTDFESSTEDVVRVLGKLRDYVASNPDIEFFITFGGGEPFLRPDVFDILDTASDLFGANRLGIESNGTLLAEDDFVRLTDLVTYLGISVDGFKEYHDWWRRADEKDGSSGFDKTIRAIQLSLELPGLQDTLEVSSVATKQNIHELPGLVKYIADLGVRNYSVHRAMPVGRLAQHPEFVPDAREYFDMLVRVICAGTEVGIQVHVHHSIESIYATLLLGAQTYAGRKAGAPDKRSSIGIDPRGNVCFDPWCMVTPWNQLSGGSLLDDLTLEEILARDILAVARDYASLEARCEGCCKPCSGGSRIAAAAAALSGPAGGDSISQILMAMTKRDTACPIMEYGDSSTA